MQALYLVALRPPEPVFSQVWALKQEIHARTGSRNAVRLPPHITLVPPTRQPDAFEADCRTALQEFAATQAPFPVGVENFAWFGNRTLFVHVAQAGSVQQFHARLLVWCAQRLPTIRPETRPFTPHMTLATRDLPADQVPELRQEFAGRRLSATFMVHSFELFRHDGQQWVSVAEFALSGAPGAEPA